MQTKITDPAVVAKIAKLAGITEDVTTLTITSPKSVVGRPCACGCGTPTAGGVWAPGHDARRKKVLYATIRSEDATDAERAEAVAELETRSWPQPTVKAPKAVEVPEDATV